MSRSYFHRRHRRDHKTPQYWIRLRHMKPERRAAKMRCLQIVNGADPEAVDLHCEEYRKLDYWL